jgi:hypothetical protein
MYDFIHEYFFGLIEETDLNERTFKNIDIKVEHTCKLAEEMKQSNVEVDVDKEKIREKLRFLSLLMSY